MTLTAFLCMEYVGVGCFMGLALMATPPRAARSLLFNAFVLTLVAAQVFLISPASAGSASSSLDTSAPPAHEPTYPSRPLADSVRSSSFDAHEQRRRGRLFKAQAILSQSASQSASQTASQLGSVRWSISHAESVTSSQSSTQSRLRNHKLAMSVTHAESVTSSQSSTQSRLRNHKLAMSVTHAESVTSSQSSTQSRLRNHKLAMSVTHAASMTSSQSSTQSRLRNHKLAPVTDTASVTSSQSLSSSQSRLRNQRLAVTGANTLSPSLSQTTTPSLSTGAPATPSPAPVPTTIIIVPQPGPGSGDFAFGALSPETIGIIVGAVAGVALVAAIIGFSHRRIIKAWRQRRRGGDDDSAPAQPMVERTNEYRWYENAEAIAADLEQRGEGARTQDHDALLQVPTVEVTKGPEFSVEAAAPIAAAVSAAVAVPMAAPAAPSRVRTAVELPSPRRDDIVDDLLGPTPTRAPRRSQIVRANPLHRPADLDHDGFL
jgi:hypothetical protein